MDKLIAILLLASVPLSSSNAVEGKTVLTNPLADLNAGTSSKLHRRQTCSLSDSSVACNNTLAQINTLIVQAYNGDPNQISTSTATTLLDQFCASECLTPVLQYYNCLGLVLQADFYNNAYCGESNGKYCFVVWLDGYAAGEQLTATSCGQYSPCSSSCQQILQDSVNYLGCCAASLYNNAADSTFSSLISPSQFSTCGVSLGEPCEDAQDSVAAAHEVRFGLMVLFVMAAMLAILWHFHV